MERYNVLWVLRLLILNTEVGINPRSMITDYIFMRISIHMPVISLEKVYIYLSIYHLLYYAI